MQRLNYHHLLYFYTVAKQGSMARASKELGVTQPTISAQIQELEQSLGCELFSRAGRSLKITDTGRKVLGYAESIFNLGSEMVSSLKHPDAKVARSIRIGVVTHLPAVLVEKIAFPLMRMRDVSISIVEDSAEALAPQLVSRAMHFVLSDVPLASPIRNRMLCELNLSFFANSTLAHKLRGKFPAGADAKFLLPSHGRMRQDVEHWLASKSVRPSSISEFPVNSLAFAAAEQGDAIAVAPDVATSELKKRYHLTPVGRPGNLRVRVHLCTLEQRPRSEAIHVVEEAVKRLR